MVDGETLKNVEPSFYALHMIGGKPLQFMGDNVHVMLRTSHGVMVWPRGSETTFESAGNPIEIPGRKNAIAYEADYKDNQKWKHFILIAGEKGPEFDDVLGPTFDSSGHHCLYLADIGNKTYVVHNGTQHLLFDFANLDISRVHLLFTPEEYQIKRKSKTKGEEDQLIASILWPPVFEVSSGRAFFALWSLEGDSVKVSRLVLNINQEK